MTSTRSLLEELPPSQQAQCSLALRMPLRRSTLPLYNGNVRRKLGWYIFCRGDASVNTSASVSPGRASIERVHVTVHAALLHEHHANDDNATEKADADRDANAHIPAA